MDAALKQRIERRISDAEDALDNARTDLGIDDDMAGLAADQAVEACSDIARLIPASPSTPRDEEESNG